MGNKRPIAVLIPIAMINWAEDAQEFFIKTMKKIVA